MAPRFVRFGGVEFNPYYLAGLRVRGGLPVYGTALAEAVSTPRATRFLYLPAVALPFAALTHLPPLPARVGFVAVQFLVLWGGVLGLLRAWGVPPTRRRAGVVGWLLAGLQPVRFVLRTGNVAGFFAGLLCASAAVTLGPRGPNRPVLGGALAGVAAFPKPYVAPAGAHLLGDRRRLLCAGVVVAGVGAAGLLWFGRATTETYLAGLSPANAWRAPRPPDRLRWHYRPLAPLGRVAWRRAAQAGFLAFAVLSALRASAAERPAAFALGCVAVPLVAPSADTLTLVVAVPDC